MNSTTPTESQLGNLERVLTEIAAAEGYHLYSPFANRHGAVQCRFLHMAASDTTQVVGVGCDVHEGTPGLLCEFTAGFSAPTGSGSRTVQTVSLTGALGTKSLLRNCFRLAAREANSLRTAAMGLSYTAQAESRKPSQGAQEIGAGATLGHHYAHR